MRARSGRAAGRAMCSLGVPHSGLRRVMIGLESGSQAMLDWMKKDVKVDQVFAAAEKCRRHGIGVLFNLIVGFPDEPDGEHRGDAGRGQGAARDRSRTFRSRSSTIGRIPGTPITDALARSGLPAAAQSRRMGRRSRSRRLAQPVGRRREADADRALRVSISASAGRGRRRGALPLQAIARWRCRRDVYAFPDREGDCSNGSGRRHSMTPVVAGHRRARPPRRGDQPHLRAAAADLLSDRAAATAAACRATGGSRAAPTISTLDEIARVADALPALGTRVVVFSGGEPLLRPGGVRGGGAVPRAAGMTLHLLTSGVLLERFAERVAEHFSARHRLARRGHRRRSTSAIRGVDALADGRAAASRGCGGSRRTSR